MGGIRFARRRLLLAAMVWGLGTMAAAQAAEEGSLRASDPSRLPAAARARHDVVVSAISEPQGIFNPYLFHNGWDENVTQVIFANLVGLDRQGRPVPQLAESWQVSRDNLVYTFKLRPNLKFSDGSPLTASDVEFTLTLLHDPKYDGETDISLANIKGGADYKAGRAGTISGIKVLDPRTIRITTTEAGAVTLPLIGGPVLSRAYYGKNYTPGHLDGVRTQSARPLGAGPYVYDKYIPGQEVRFHANPYYYAGKPPVPFFIYRITSDATKLQLFQTGEVDNDRFSINKDNIEQLKSLGFANIDIYNSSDYSLVEFNLKKPYLKDVRVRQALIYGLDRQKLVDVVYQGYGSVATEAVAPGSWAYDPSGVNPYAYNPARARTLLDQAGWKVGADGIRVKDGQRLTLTLLATRKLLTDALIPIAKESYKAIGVELRPEVSDFNALLAKRKAGHYDLATFSTSLINDPNEGVHDFLTSQSVNGYHNPQVDRLTVEANATLDLKRRKQLYHQLYQVLAGDPPVIYLAYRKVLSASSARISGFTPDIYNGIITSLPHLKIVK
ncbi:ABC transporter substrate-binding protein [Paludibacterium yongneupense]|uniref:ABC transporter substrate-binding protein n=1 Tax=Paludibacterium yongneupense TaxID=400061 RepID=UPI0003F920D8|nr:ABC transporter substrate-binding protein [Paludibacterium yongneupense]